MNHQPSNTSPTPKGPMSAIVFAMISFIFGRFIEPTSTITLPVYITIYIFIAGYMLITYSNNSQAHITSGAANRTHIFAILMIIWYVLWFAVHFFLRNQNTYPKPIEGSIWISILNIPLRGSIIFVIMFTVYWQKQLNNSMVHINIIILSLIIGIVFGCCYLIILPFVSVQWDTIVSYSNGIIPGIVLGATTGYILAWICSKVYP